MASQSDCGQHRPLWTARRELSTVKSTVDKGNELKGKAQSIRTARTGLGVVVVGGQDSGP